MFSAAEAARFIDEAHRTRARYRNLPETIAPSTVAEAYAAQAALVELWGPRIGPVAGLKIATTTKVMQALMGIDHPCMGTIFAERVLASPVSIAKADHVNVRIECELAVRLGRDLPAAGAPYTREAVRGAVSEVMAAFEPPRGPQPVRLGQPRRLRQASGDGGLEHGRVSLGCSRLALADRVPRC